MPSFNDDADVEKTEFPECPGGLDFTNPNSAVAIRMVSSKGGGYSRFLLTRRESRPDLAGPVQSAALRSQRYRPPAPTTIVNGKHDLMAFMTASKENGREGRVFCTRTTDGGKTWKLVSWIGPEPEGFSIMFVVRAALRRRAS